MYKEREVCCIQEYKEKYLPYSLYSEIDRNLEIYLVPSKLCSFESPGFELERCVFALWRRQVTMRTLSAHCRRLIFRHFAGHCRFRGLLSSRRSRMHENCPLPLCQALDRETVANDICHLFNEFVVDQPAVTASTSAQDRIKWYSQTYS